MDRKLSMALIAAFLLVITNAYGGSIDYIPAPQKQIANGIAVEDVVCKQGLTLMLKLSSNSSACVKPSTALKLQEKGWGTILKESSMMEKQRIGMLEKGEQLAKDDQEKIIPEKPMEDKKTDEKINVVPVYDPKITPRSFVPTVTNKFFTLVTGSTLVYESKSNEGVERTEVSVTGEGRKVMGIDITVVQEKVWVNDKLVEDTKDWYAEDLEGNVWYFGEVSKEFVDGKMSETMDSWEAGVDGAKPGIIMKAEPKIGDSYRQEYYPGKSEDMGEVVSVNDTVSVPYGSFSDCIKTKEWSPLEPRDDEFDYYCAGIGGLVLETDSENNQRVELTDVFGPLAGSAKEATTDISVEEAKQIALKEVPGIVTNVEIDSMNGRSVYVIEIAAKTGIETDVFVDMKN